MTKGPRRKRSRWLVVVAAVVLVLYAAARVGKTWSLWYADQRAHRFIHAPY
jgi:hypothetical protein